MVGVRGQAGTQAPASDGAALDGTEITFEMVEAGAAALVAADSSYRRWPEEDRSLVREIYEAMEAARLGARGRLNKSSLDA